MKNRILILRELTITVPTPTGEKTLVNNLNLEIPEFNIVALVGGSGSGKTTTGLSVLRLLQPGLNIASGKIIFNGRDLLQFSEEAMRSVRGKEVSMIFQEPLNAFNPVFSIGYQIEEVLKFHTTLSSAKRKERVFQLLDVVGIPDPKRIADNYPHQLSGGLRQRAMIAQAISADPKLIIADEPTSNLDVTLQAHIMELFRELKDKLGLSILLITHDLGMVSHLSDQVAVMTEGEIVEYSSTENVTQHPQHIYTRQLMAALGD